MLELLPVSARFPVGGLNEITAFEDQPGDSTPDAQNVRPFDPGTGRARGGQRPGLSRHINARVSGANPVQCLEKFVEYNAYSGATSLDTRTIKFVAVSNGTVKVGTTTYSTPTNGVSALASTVPLITAANFYDDVYFADGNNTKYLDTSADEVKSWPSTAGSHPGAGCRLVCTYNNRVVLSGLASDPQNFFASAVGAPGDFDYSPTTVTSTQAFAGNLGEAATIPDKITALIPIPNSDVLILGGDHSIAQMSGDIAAGGRMDQLSDTIGVAWGEAFCFNREGQVYFWSSRGGLGIVAANHVPRILSEDSLPDELASIDLSDTLVRLLWDDRFQGVWIFITPLDGSATTNYFFDERTKTFWKDVFADANHNPVSVLLFDGDDPNDRVGLIGCQDGYVRALDKDSADDDASAISSYVYIGPFQSPNHVNVVLNELTATLANGSSNVTYEIFVGDNAEEAFNATGVFVTGTWAAGRNIARRKRVNARSFWLKLSNSTSGETWSMETVDCVLRETGRQYSRVFR